MRVSCVHGVCVKYDAISNSIRDQIHTLQRDSFNDIRLYAYCCEHDDLPFTKVNLLQDVILDARFQASDLIIFHFGVFYPLFNLLPVSPRRAKRLVVFHNITPRHLVPPQERGLIEKSFAQMSNVVWADHVVCDSNTNLEVLRYAGVHTPATVLPLAVHTDASPPVEKPSFKDGIIRIAFVGRFAKSKGPCDLLAAVGKAVATTREVKLHVALVGNKMFSDTVVRSEMAQAVSTLETQFGRRVTVEIHGDAPEEAKRRILRDADLFVLPSYHEGFCVPIVEAMASGCRVIAYSNSNIPAVSGGLATLAVTGNVDSLSMAIQEAMKQVSSAQWHGEGSGSYEEYSRIVEKYVDRFSPPRIAKSFVGIITNLVREARTTAL